jgi:hypothetical protein
MITAHGFIARENVFESARQQVVNAGLAIGRRRPFIKDKFWPALAGIHRLMEDVVRFPET